MEDTQHTPGPWTAEIFNGAQREARIFEGEKFVMMAPIKHARLIAAAPDLLAALEVLTHGKAHRDNETDPISVGLRAIAKAKGEA